MYRGVFIDILVARLTRPTAGPTDHAEVRHLHSMTYINRAQTNQYLHVSYPICLSLDTSRDSRECDEPNKIPTEYLMEILTRRLWMPCKADMCTDMRSIMSVYGAPSIHEIIHRGTSAGCPDGNPSKALDPRLFGAQPMVDGLR